MSFSEANRISGSSAGLKQLALQSKSFSGSGDAWLYSPQVAQAAPGGTNRWLSGKRKEISKAAPGAVKQP